MDYEQSGDRLTVRLAGDFNLLAVQRIEPLAREAERVVIDLADARLMDSEALVLIDRLQRAGKTVRLIDPPPLFFEMVEVLELEPVFDVDALVASAR